MAQIFGRGSFINGQFVNDGTLSLTSYNPSSNYEAVFTTKSCPTHVQQAVLSAKNAFKPWAKLSQEERNHYLLALKEAFLRHKEALANSICLEMGKVISEARLEALSLGARIDLMLNQGLKKVANNYLANSDGYTRYHPQGVMVIMGPFNFPGHLINAHVIPALMMGNTVVIKPSEICPWVGEIYAQCLMEAGFPPGVVNMIQGDGLIGKALCLHKDVDGVLFTGSYKTGRSLMADLLDQPHKILALEMGGKNFAVVMNDADLEQAIAEIISGAYLTTGQRCTATARVLCQKEVYQKLKFRLINIIKKLKPGYPLDEKAIFGPLATKKSLENFLQKLKIAKKEDAHVLVESQELGHGAFVTPSLYEINPTYSMPGYLDEEIFGPHLALEEFSILDEAILRINNSPYGLSNSIFTLNQHNFERLFYETKSGLLNLNKSTNGALGQLPFGGVNKSGNQRPAGIDAVFYTTFPVAIAEQVLGETKTPLELKKIISEGSEIKDDLNHVITRHKIEKIFENFYINSHNAFKQYLIFNKSSFNSLKNRDEFFDELKNLFKESITINDINLEFNTENISQDLLNNLNSLCDKYCTIKLPSLAINTPAFHIQTASKNALARLYYNNFLPKEKKSPVIDLNRSRKAYLASIDDDPLVLFDAASQIATLGAGFLADTWQNAYDTCYLDASILKNIDLTQDFFDEHDDIVKDAKEAQTLFEEYLLKKSNYHFKSVSYGASGAEANEIAFDLARQNGPGGTRVIAFEGSFHGRTIVSLQATYNLEKRGPFQFKGYEACFLPWPNQILAENDLLLKEEETLSLLIKEVEKGDVLAVIIEPIQCEGGDNYASKRFFQNLRKLTQDLKIPLILDEVQTGFHLGRTFFWYQELGILPDCVTLGKKAQLGVVLSIWPNKRKYRPHIVQLKRGLLHAKAIDTKKALKIEKEVNKHLLRLKEHFPRLIQHERIAGFSFAFDMPTPQIANEIINRRFESGFMAYIAGEKTLRFRLNVAVKKEDIISFFNQLHALLMDFSENKKSVFLPLSSPAKKTALKDYKIYILNKENIKNYIFEIEQIENATYEEGRRDSMESLCSWFDIKDNICLALRVKIHNEEILAGYAFGGPLEYSHVDGPKDDVLRTQNITYYSANITINPLLRGQGFGRLLKEEQIRLVLALKNLDQTPRYHFLTGRNRLDYATQMMNMNEQYGAYTVGIYDKQYNDQNGQALYYRLPLRKNLHLSKVIKESLVIDCQNSTENLTNNPNKALFEDLNSNYLRTICGTKLTLSNWATMGLVRYTENLRQFMPNGLNHAYFTSGHDEVVDKGLRALRFHRHNADIAIGFSHQWLGNITSAARSLTHDAGEIKPFGYFSWPLIPHPEVVGDDISLQSLQSILNKYEAQKILGIVLELIGKNSSYTFSKYFLEKLDEIRKHTGIPIIYNETVSSFFRNGSSFFLSDSLDVKPNMIWWFTGGQLGHVLVDDKYYVEKPLTLISTWDGDEISIARNYHNMLLAIEYFESSKWLIKLLDEINIPYNKFGRGFWRGFHINNDIKLNQIIDDAKKQNIFLSRGYDNMLLVCPKMDIKNHDGERLVEFLHNII